VESNVHGRDEVMMEVEGTRQRV